MGRLQRSLLILGVFAAFTAPAAPPTTAAPTRVCSLFVDKVARPNSLLLGDEVEITLSMEARCPPSQGNGPADIILAIDASSSMSEGGHWQPALDAASSFLQLIDFSSHQVGLVTFGLAPFAFLPDTAVNQPLSSDKEAVSRALAAIPQPLETNWSTNLTGAIVTAQGELTSSRHRSSARSVLILLTDGAHNDLFARSPITQASETKAAGTEIITIGLGTTAAAAEQLKQIASRPELFFESPTNDALKDVYTRIAGQLAGGSPKDLVVTDLLTPDVAYVEGSAVPTPTYIRGGEMSWTVPSLSANGWAARYKVKPLRAGTYATNKLAYVDYVDVDGTVGNITFPQPIIKVRLPGENGIFLPILMRDHCPPQRPFDVVLVMDTSTSMEGEKLAQARLAAGEFLDILPMPPSRAAIVAFNKEATVVRPLTSDRMQAATGLDNLPRGEGSRIDLALDVAREALTGPDADAGHAKVVVLLTDGKQTGAPDQNAFNAAAAARRAGITVFTIGVGPDAEAEFLVRVAGDPARSFAAPDQTSLLAIYRSIAGSLPCIVP